MYRVSQYNIYLKLKQKENQTLVIQGNRGSFDVMDTEIAEVLEAAEQDVTMLSQISDENKEILIKRGYLTSQTEEEEYEFIKKVSKALNNVSRNIISVTMMPTYNCNFRCEYCFEQNLFEKGKEWLCGKMTKETVDAVFKQLLTFKEEGKKLGSVYLFGGEPLLSSNKDIVEYICSKCRENDISISCISNGYDLDSYIDLLVEYQFDKIQITLDGVAEEHDSRRFLVGGQGTYDKITRNISLALENDINIMLRTNVNKKNTDGILTLLEEYKKQGWLDSDHFYYYFKTTLRCYEEVGDAMSDVELMKQLAEYFGEDTGRFQFNSIYQGLASSITDMFKKNSFAPMRSGYCGANTGLYTIDPYGDIYPCWDVLAQEDSKIGTVDNASGTFVLNDVHDTWKERTVDRIDDCKSCRYLMFCGGGCAAQAIVMNDDMDKVYCDDFTHVFDEVVVDVCEKHLQELEATV